jgi:hypothetical protein
VRVDEGRKEAHGSPPKQVHPEMAPRSALSTRSKASAQVTYSTGEGNMLVLGEEPGGLITDLLRETARSTAEAKARRTQWTIIAGVSGLALGVMIGWHARSYR